MFKGNFNKRLEKLETNYSKIKTIEKVLKQLVKRTDSDSRNFDKDIESNVWALKKHIEGYEDFQADTEKTINTIRKSFSSKNMLKIRKELDGVSQSVKALAKHSTAILRKFSLANKDIADLRNYTSLAVDTANTVDERAREIENKAIELDRGMAELRDLARHFYLKTDQINTKLNATISSMSDSHARTDKLIVQMGTVHNRLALLNRLKEQMDLQRASISELKQRFDYFEKTSSRTIVLD